MADRDYKAFIVEGEVSAFPEFLLDYFGVKLWRKCVKHTTNLYEKQECRNE